MSDKPTTRQYAILTSYDASDLEDEVTAFLQKGWELAGNLVVAAHDEEYAQPIQFIPNSDPMVA